jgi:hypothetical protein
MDIYTNCGTIIRDLFSSLIKQIRECDEASRILRKFIREIGDETPIRILGWCQARGMILVNEWRLEDYLDACKRNIESKKNSLTRYEVLSLGTNPDR